MGESRAGGKRRARRRHKPSRAIAPNQVVPPPSGISIKARVDPSEHDYMVFLALGDYLTPLRNRDLVAALHGVEWDDRRNILTPLCSARWAGTITRDNNDLIALAIRNRDAEIADRRRAIAVIEARLAQPIPEKKEKGKPGSVPAPDEGVEGATGEDSGPDSALAGKRPRAGKSKVVGYSSQDERAAKLLRLHRLRADLAAAERDAATGHLHICRGTAALLRKRLHLDEAHITYDRWRDEWIADRRCINANGESGKNLGNETIRLDEAGRLYIDLPPALSCLANAKGHRYILDATAVFHYRAQEWLAQVTAKKAVSYSLDENGETGRWYLTASWTRKPEKGSTAEGTAAIKTAPAARHRTLGIDLNADHIACVVTDEHGNPVGTPLNIRLELKGMSADTRDGRIRYAITEALKYGKHLGATRVSIENLGFADSKGRELFGHNRKFRATISGFPTAQFCQRIGAMSARAGMALVTVDPAYTSQWGKEHWANRLSTPHRKATVHEGAAAVIARREQGYRARIALGKRTGEQSIQAGGRISSRKRVPVAAGLRLPVARQAQMEIASGKAPNGRPGTRLKSCGETGSSHRGRKPIPQGEDRALPHRLLTPPDRSSGVGFVRF